MCRIIQTGLESFDAQTRFLGLGNVVSNTQLSAHIKKETFESDLKCFDLVLDQKNFVLNFLNEFGDSILYKFFFKKRGEDEIVGFIITNKEKSIIKMFGARTKKRIEALDSIYKVIASK